MAADGSPLAELVVLVDPEGRPIGQAEKAATHHADTPLHLAFSCYLFDGRGRFLVTRRALAKQVWPGAWSNSLCGHPAPGETVPQAIARRLAHELGMSARDLSVALPSHSYRAPPFRGIVEHEFCPVYVARAVGEPDPNPDEVAAYSWAPWDDFARSAAADTADRYSWWCKNQLAELAGHPLIARYARPESA